VAESLEVTATWIGGYEARVRARAHEVTIDEPSATDHGMMPTEAFCAAIASCFCLALAHVAGKRGKTLRELEVVVRATRAGRELRYERFELMASADASDEELGKLMEPARRVCWVSNTLVHGVTLEYSYTSVDGRTRR
jgi:putative redox protein